MRRLLRRQMILLCYWCVVTALPLPLCADKPDMMSLSARKHKGVSIIQASAGKIFEVGAFLLGDSGGIKVTTMKQNAFGDVEEAMRRVYMQWMQQDEECSWEKLAACFRKCDLNDLANYVETNFLQKSK